MITSPALHCHLRQRREDAGVTLTRLAGEVGISRQALSRVESGAAVPGTHLALLLARALHCRVEDLFTLRGTHVTAQPLGEVRAGARVRLGRVDGDWRALPLGGEAGLRHPADGVVSAVEAGGPARVEILAPLDDLTRTTLVAGCDPALGLLCERAGVAARAAWLPQASLDAVRAAARGEVHAAGLHLGGPSGHREVLARELQGAHLIRLWEAQQGLMVAAGNPLGMQDVRDLARAELRLVTRAPGAGGRALLDGWLAKAGLDRRAREARHAGATMAASPLEAARRVARGEADAAPGPRSAAQAHGLDFLPLHTESFDLAIPERHLTHPGVQALLAAARSPAFQEDLRSLGGYDPAGAGEPSGSPAAGGGA